MSRLILTVAALAMLAGGCGAPGRSPAPPRTVAAPGGMEPTPLEPTPIQTAQPTFHGIIGPIPTDLAAEMRRSTWHSGCPVPIADLRLLTLSYWGFDGELHEGPLVVNASVARILGQSSPKRTITDLSGF